MPRTDAIAKKDFPGIFKKGETVTIISILYEEDTLIRHQLNGVFDNNGYMVKIYDPYTDGRLKKFTTGEWVVKKISDPLYAPKSSFKRCYIELEDGRQYPSEHFRNFADFFEKIDSS